jgi:hypothetical protein
MFVLIIALIGCATGSIIISGNTRTAIDPSEVKIYLEPPTQYETIGIVEASSDVELSRQVAQDRVINKLKSKSAKVGANGLLLVATGSQSSGTAGYISNGIFFASTIDKITAQGKAIYVTKE